MSGLKWSSPKNLCLMTYEPHHEKTRFLPMRYKGADQLHSNWEADQHLCFGYMNSTFHLLSKSKLFKLLVISCSCTGWFVLDLGNPEDRFSCIAAHMILIDWLVCRILPNFILISLDQFPFSFILFLLNQILL